MYKIYNINFFIKKNTAKITLGVFNDKVRFSKIFILKKGSSKKSSKNENRPKVPQPGVQTFATTEDSLMGLKKKIVYYKIINKVQDTSFLEKKIKVPFS